MHGGTAMHGRAASGSSGISRNTFWIQANFPASTEAGAKQTEVCLASADVRGAKQRSVLLQPMCAEPNRGLFCFSRCARSQTEVCLLQPMCAEPNRGLFCFSRCAQPRSGGLHASADVRGLVQGVCMLQPMCAASFRGSVCFSRCARSQTEVCLTSIPTDSDGSNARHRVKPPPSTCHSFLF